MGKRKVCFHPFFRVELVQMLRHGEIAGAIKKAADELALAMQDTTGGGGTGDGTGTDDGGVVMVPSRTRAIELGYVKGRSQEISKQKERGYEHGR